MADSWTTLFSNSTLGAGHDAWEHLNAQAGGGELRYVAENGLEFSIEPSNLEFITDTANIMFDFAASNIDFSITESPIVFSLTNTKYTFVLTKVLFKE